MNLRDATKTRAWSRTFALVVRWRLPALALALIGAAVAGACNGSQAPHGSPILLKVYWQVPGARILVWPIDASDGGVARPVPPAASQFSLIFDRVLDGSKIEDTVTINGITGPKAKGDPPVKLSWPDMPQPTDEPHFKLTVWYNSVSLTGEKAGSAYVYGRETPSYPSDTPITVTFDKIRITSQYNEPMIGPEGFSVMTEPFLLKGTVRPAGDGDGGIDPDGGEDGDAGDGGGGAAVVTGDDELPHGRQVPVDYWVPLHFNNLPAAAELLRPYIHVTSDGGAVDKFGLISDPDDPTLVHLQPPLRISDADDPTRPALRQAWVPGARIDVTIDVGLPDVFGKPLVTPASASFIACSGDCAVPDGGGPIDATVDTPVDAAPPDAGSDAGDDASQD